MILENKTSKLNNYAKIENFGLDFWFYVDTSFCVSLLTLIILESCTGLFLKYFYMMLKYIL